MASPLALCVLLASLDGPPVVDAFLEHEPARALEDGLRAEGLELLRRSHVTAQEPRRGVPTILWAERVTGARAPRAQGLSAAEAARQHLLRYAAVYRLHPEEVARLAVTTFHDPGRGAVVVGFGRAVDGVPVLRDELDVVMTAELQLVAFTGSLATHRRPRAAFQLTAETALAAAARSLTGALVRELEPTAPRHGWRRFEAAGPFTEPSRARPVYFDDGAQLAPAWQLEVTTSQAAFAVVVAADDGRVLLQAPLDAHAAHAYRVFADASAPFRPLDSPVGDAALPHPSGTPAPPALPGVAASLVTLDHAGLSTGDPWLPAGASQLLGNNVHAYADLAAPDGLPTDAGTGGDLLIAPSAPGAFDFTYDFGAAPDLAASQRAASATQAFFVTNWLHDAFYDLGFDEAARNGQRDNFGRGGLDGDALRVEVHDVASRNNASLRTRADGEPARMQLLLFDVARPSTLTVTTTALADGGLFVGATPAVDESRAWDVTGPVEVLRDLDGGTSGCDAWPQGLEGAVVLVDVTGCPVRQRFDAALDAGVAALLVSTAGCFPFDEGTLVATCVDEDAGTQLRALREGGATLSARLERPPAGPDRDVAFDTTVVAHEWGHFLTSRLVGDSLGLLNTAARGLGEGWSDFLALWLSARADDVQRPGNDAWQGTFAVGGWVRTGLDVTGGELPAHYFGFRRYPYSTDRAKNPLTYKHVGLNVPLPDVTLAPRASGGGPNNAQIHNAGEVWASALWDAQVALFQKPGATVDGARAEFGRHLVAALKATPVTPTFIEGRDALLAVVFAASPTDDFPRVVQAFAARGFGVHAQAADRRSTTNTPLAEDFTGAGGLYRVVSVGVTDDVDSCDEDEELDAREAGHVVVRLMNVGTRRLTASTVRVTSDLLPLVIPVVDVPVPPSDPFEVVEARVPAALGGVSGFVVANLAVTVSDPALALPGGRLAADATVRLNRDRVASDTEGFERGAAGWVMDGDGDYPWEQTFFVRPLAPPTGFSLSGRNMDGAGDSWARTPPLAVGAGPLSFTFRHRYAFEFSAGLGRYYDGGRLELSTDGETFTPIASSALSPGYPVSLATGTANPLAGEEAFGGALATPELVTVSLGAQYANRTVWVRWRIGADAAVGALGWELDDISFTGLTTPPFQHVVPHRAVCRNRAPTVQNTSSLSVDERTLVTLVPGTMADPDGDVLTVTWLQTSGPSVELFGDLFTAPEVTRDGALLGFRVTVDDGRGGLDTDDMTVRVRNVNRRPEVTASAPQQVTSGELVTLEAMGSDLDGDVLRSRWQEEGGASVTLEGADTLAASFTAPEVTVPSQLVFRVTVFDADTASEPVLVSLVVNPKATGCGCGAGEGGGLLLVALALARRRRRC